MLTPRYKHAVNHVLRPLAASFVRCGVSPSAITLSVPVLTLAVCVMLVRTHAVLPFCVLMGVVGGFDALDGAVARVGGQVTKVGAYLDAVCDRYVEAMVVVAAASVTGYWALAMIVLAGAFLVSYTKARAAMEVPVSNQEWPDLMERTERSVLFLLGFAASRLVPWRPWGKDLFWWTLVVLAGLIHVTVIQRILRARGLIRARSGSP